MDAASRIGLPFVVFIGSFFFCDSAFAQEATKPDRIVISNPMESIAQWFGQWIAKPPTVSVRFAIHELAQTTSQSAKMDAVVPCGHKICAGGKCYEVEEGVIEGTPCDAPRPKDTIPPAEDEPIIEAPVAPPLPTSYQFTQQTPRGSEHRHHQAILDSLQTTQVSVPATVLVALLVDHARNETQLAMTRELLEERTAFLEQVRELSDRNTQLQSQLAVSQMYLDYYATTRNTDTSINPTTDLRSIHEDLSNIRKQIALLKRNQPIPFAPSYVGSEAQATNNSPQKTIK